MTIIDPRLSGPMLLLAAVATSWALFVLFGSSGLIGVSGGLGAGLYSWRHSGDIRAADRAITAHTDPGPGIREAADGRARSVLARPRVEDWAVFVVLLAAGAACLVAAVVRDAPSTAVPGAVLVLLAPAFWLLDRRGLLAARWWLDYPPFDRVDQP